MPTPPNQPPARSPFDLRSLVCPACHHTLKPDAGSILCAGCGRRYPIVDGIPVLIVERAS